MSTESGQSAALHLSEALEDYLEIILGLSLERRTIRVRDIARAKAVRMPTVTWALHRLSERGLVRYEAREYIELTAQGEAIARRVASRHGFLTRFLADVLGVPTTQAEEDACGLEHHLSPASLERLAAFVEYIDTCPEVDDSFLDRFRSCFGDPDKPACDRVDCQRRRLGGGAPRRGDRPLLPVTDLEVGAAAEIVRIQASGTLRRRLMRRGLLPGAAIEKVEGMSAHRRATVRIDGHRLVLTPGEAASIFVEPVATKEEEPRDDAPE